MTGLVWLIVFIVSVVLSGVFSGFEISYVSMGRSSFGLWFRGRMKRFFVRNPERVMTACLVGNNVVNVASAVSLTNYFILVLGSIEQAVALGGLICTVGVLIFGEILPKVISRAYAHPMARIFAPLIYGFYRVTTSVVRFLEFFVRRVLLRRLKPVFRGKEEVELLILREHTEGLVSEEETQTLISALHLSDRQAGEMMTPAKDVLFLSADLAPDVFIQETKATDRYRIPVYRGDLDNILGMVHVKDLIFCLRMEAPVSKQIRPVAYLFKDWPLSKVLREMKERGTSTGIVTDEHGVTVGVLTLEDIARTVIG
jgi:putative hemolysin